MRTIFLSIAVAVFGQQLLAAHPNSVAIVETGGERMIKSNGIPDHETGRFPNRNNPNTIEPQSYELRMTLDPRENTRARDSRGFLFGVAVNGVVLDPGTAEFWQGDPAWNYEAKSGEIDLGLDQSNAHVQPTGAYHYHGIPILLLLDRGGQKPAMTLLGWAADGFPIYGPFGLKDPKGPDSGLSRVKSSYRVKEGKRDGGPGGKFDGAFIADYEYVAGLGDLDEANGRFGVTPEYPDGIYHYHLTDEYPFIPRMFRGEPDESFAKRDGGPGGPGAGPPGGPKGKGRPPFPPPPPRG